MINDDETLVMIEDCTDRAGKLSDWETGFIDSISSSYAEYGSLTTKQMDKLNDIWNRVTENG